jgi:hypothetical protein
MMRALGFEWREDGVGVPELGALIQAIEGRFDAMIRDGQLTEADVMRPARVFVGADGERFAVAWGQPVPEGARPDSGVIELGFVLEMMRDGHFILGDHGSFNSPEDLHALLTVFLHDMGHWTAFAENPAYMKAVRALSGEMAARGVSWDTDVDLARRFTFVLENVSVIDAEHRPELLKTFGLDRDVPVTAEAMRQRARRLSPRLLGERIDATLALFARVDHPYGGSNRDLIQNPVRHAQESDTETAGQYGHWFTMDYMAFQLRALKESGAPRAELETALGRLQAAMLAASRLKIEDVVQAMTEPVIGPGSPVHACYVESGAWDREHAVFQALFGDAKPTGGAYEFRG